MKEGPFEKEDRRRLRRRAREGRGKNLVILQRGRSPGRMFL